jgi:hypothetical protein
MYVCVCVCAASVCAAHQAEREQGNSTIKAHFDQLLHVVAHSSHARCLPVGGLQSQNTLNISVCARCTEVHVRVKYALTHTQGEREKEIERKMDRERREKRERAMFMLVHAEARKKETRKKEEKTRKKRYSRRVPASSVRTSMRPRASMKAHRQAEWLHTLCREVNGGERG